MAGQSSQPALADLPRISKQGLTLPVAIAKGGTGATSESGARTNLGVAVDSDVQAFDVVLEDLAALSAVADNEVIVGTGAGAYAHESGDTLRTSLGLAIGSDVQAHDADTLKADTADVLTAGFAATIYDAGDQTTGTFTPDESNGNMQKAVNGGAHTLAPPSNDCTIVIQYTNDGSAGTITTSGFTVVDGNALTTTDTDDFFFFIVNMGTFSSLTIKALQ